MSRLPYIFLCFRRFFFHLNISPEFTSYNRKLPLDDQIFCPEPTEQPVIPAKAGIRFLPALRIRKQWIPAFAGMTEKNLITE
ncbi:Uncharacterized protein dnm_023970 [Desulfonema magnum]|uniref:Uncharacterized protein n=1 Tax=Desulfonema magnum TaxID=45655 RepID=A0A975BJC1_9BACT|nr:Uncharacterized protein dnm_023970 [Desulfonema magnum]